MNIVLFERYGIPSTLLHAEIIKNVGPIWPSRLNFSEVFLLHLPVTRRLMGYCIEAVSKENTKKLKKFPELLPYLETLDPKRLLEMDLIQIIKIEGALNPVGLTPSEQVWLGQMLDVAKNFTDEAKVTLKDDGQIEVKVDSDYAAPELILSCRDGFPDLPPCLDGTFEEVLTLEWTKTTTLTNLITKFAQQSTDLTPIYSELAEFTEPKAFLRLIHPETRKTLRNGELHCIRFDPAIPSCLIVPLVIVSICGDGEPTYIRIWIDTRAPEEYPQKLEAPEEFYDVDKWDREKSLSINLNCFFMREKYEIVDITMEAD
uniref:DUF1822 family protein n=1 Tax=Panagrellus redivivus TaxID=6233 RepID=A0A7E4W7E4_PANRE